MAEVRHDPARRYSGSSYLRSDQALYPAPAITRRRRPAVLTNSRKTNSDLHCDFLSLLQIVGFKCLPRAVADVKNIDFFLLLQNLVDHTINVGFPAEEQVS